MTHDLRTQQFLSSHDCAGLLGQARHAPVTLLVAPGSQPDRKLRQLFGGGGGTPGVIVVGAAASG